MIEAPVQITDEYVRKYLWEHNLVAVDESDFKKLMQRKWVRLTDEEKDELINRWAGELVFEVEQALREKNK